jgi:hypothetical protein
MLKTKGEEEILVQGFMFKIINVLGEKNETEAAKKRDRSSKKKETEAAKKRDRSSRKASKRIPPRRVEQKTKVK